MKIRANNNGRESWVATRAEVKNLLGLRERNLLHLEHWANVKSSAAKTGYTKIEFERLKKRISELRRHVTL